MGTLTEHDKMVLKRDGFVDIEIKQYDEAVDPEGKPQNINIESEGWKKVRSDRAKFMRKYRKGGADYKRYEAHVTDLYNKRKGGVMDSAFDFLKAEYARYLSQQDKPSNPTDAKAGKIVKKVYKGWWWKA